MAKYPNTRITPETASVPNLKHENSQSTESVGLDQVKYDSSIDVSEVATSITPEDRKEKKYASKPVKLLSSPASVLIQKGGPPRCDPETETRAWDAPERKA
ncbi:hypothetical protein JCM33374_g4199 [Metschnikowia sp. JCM 33374]|nr:hypothetical protein JCM33374_g4199 [Metschnikowia sp. JCM 33374]